MILSKALRGHILIAICVIASFAVLPLFIGERYLLGQIITFFFWAIVASQWNLIMGHGGVFSLAQMFFFACGAYATAMMVEYGGISIWAALPLAGLISSGFAVLIGAACLRLSGAYVALLTYAIATMVQVLIITDTNCYQVVGGVCQELFGGATGFSGFEDFGFRATLKGNWIVGNYFVVLGVFAITMLVTVVVIHGRYGLAFRAIRDNLGYASSRGISRFRYQMIVFAISAFFTGLAGAAYAGHFKFAGPSLFDFSTAIMVLSMVIVGGSGSTWGPIIGTAVIMVVIEWMKEFGDARNLGLGLALILFVIFLPGGLAAAGKRLPDRLKGLGRSKVAKT
jgi:branched-chain amino acid transport system permease protein